MASPPPVDKPAPVRGKAPALPPGRMAVLPSAKAGAAPPVPGRPAALVAIPEKHTSDLVNIHWKAPAAASWPAEDPFLRPFSPPTSSSLGVPSALVKSVLYPSVFTSIDSPSAPPQELLRKYFQRKQNKLFDSSGGSSGSQSQEPENKLRTALDRERIKLISLAIGGSLGSRSVNKREVFRLYREAIVECNYEIARTEVLCPLLQLLENVTAEEFRAVVTSIVRELEGTSTAEETVLAQYEEADVFLFEMSKIPQVKTRLECMIFEQSFLELFRLSVESLDVIYAALEALHALSGKLARLFQFVLHLGNLLNEGSRLSNQSCFSLSSLEKLLEVKSSLDPKVDLLHFVLAVFPEEGLFSETDFSKLKKAANLRSYRVRDEVKDLLDSVRAVEELPEIQTGTDRFAQKMIAFSGSIAEKKQWLSNYAFNVFSSYKQLCDFFGDPAAVYPPPKEKVPDQFDILELFAWFAGVLKQHEKDVKKQKLKSRIEWRPVAKPPAPLVTANSPVIMPPFKSALPDPPKTAIPESPQSEIVIPRSVVSVTPPVVAPVVAQVATHLVPQVATSLVAQVAAPVVAQVATPVVAPAAAPAEDSPSVSPLRNPAFTPPGSPPILEVKIPEPPRKSSISQSALQSSIANLRAPTPPIAAIVTRVGDSKQDLSASRPVLSIESSPPTLQFLVSPVDDTQPAYPLEQQKPLEPVSATPKKRLLITSRGGLSGILRPSPLPNAGTPLPQVRALPIVGIPSFSAYPSRREGMPDPDNYLDSRQSLSNTVNRVSLQLMSPSREDPVRRPGTASVLPPSLFRPY